MLTIENVSNTLNGILDTNDHTLHVFITDDDGSWGNPTKAFIGDPKQDNQYGCNIGILYYVFDQFFEGTD